MPEPITRMGSDPGAIIEHLAKHLWWTFERLDPSDGGETWEALSAWERGLYREVVIQFLVLREDLKAAIKLEEKGEYLWGSDA